MSGPERQPPDDRMLDDFLAGRSPVSRAWRDATRDDAAPPEMDDAVLRLAREELSKPAPPARDRFRDRRWPLALVAVLVLSFSTILNIRQDPAALKDAMRLPTETVPVTPVTAPAAADQVIPMQQPEPAKPLAPPAVGDAQRRQVQEQSAAAAGAASRRAMELESREQEAVAKRKAEASFAPAPAGPAEGDADAAPLVMEAEEPLPQAAPAPPAPASEKRPEVEVLGGSSEADQAPEASKPTLQDRYRSAVRAKKGQAEAPAAALAAEQKPTSAKRLEQVRRLLAEGHEEEAGREFQAWRREFPKEPVPADLRWLEAPR